MKRDYHSREYFYRRIVQAKLFIDTHYARKIDLENIAGEAYFSKFHFIRAFKNIYRKTPHQYLISVRIDKAMELLKAGIPVSEVCYSVGFESLTSFSGLFRRMAGSTPSEYLAQHQKTLSEMERSPLSFIPGCFAEKSGWLKK